MTNNLGHIADFTSILSYLADYVLTFVIAVTASTSREVYNYQKSNIRISIFRIIFGAIITSSLLVAVSQYTEFNFAIYSLLTFLFGLFSLNILEILLNVKYTAIVAKNILKELGNPLLKGVSNAIDEVKKEKKAETEGEKKEKEDDKKEPKQDETTADGNTTVEYTKEELLAQIKKLEAERDNARQYADQQ